MRNTALLLCLLITQANLFAQTARSEWVYPGPNGKLVYKTTAKGDRIMDYSYAGYMGGGVRIPNVPAVKTLSPVSGDNAPLIQQAINELASKTPLNGFRGAILLQPGIYNCEAAINITASGIVLRGSGAGPNGTVFNMTGKPHACIVVRGKVNTQTIGMPVPIADTYVPAGAYGFRIADRSGFKAGDTIRISKPVSDSWVAFMGMQRPRR